MRPLRPRIKLWLADAETSSAFGDGKWLLLEAVGRTGSLQAAAEAVGMSYRKAWGDLRKAENRLGLTFLERRRGGSAGGESRLTPEGKKWVREYRRFQKDVDRAVKKGFKELMERIRG